MPSDPDALPAVIGASGVVLFTMVALSGSRRHYRARAANGLLFRDLRRWTESRRYSTHHLG
jgi:hypothetical protein